MFERFTKRARAVLAVAHEEASALGHNFLGTEHILLGLLRDPDGVAGQVLLDSDITYASARQRVLDIVGPGAGATGLRDADALAAIGIDLDAVTASVEESFGEGALERSRPSRQHRAKFVPRARRVVELSLKEAKSLDHNYIGTEHLLLAILRLGEGVAFLVLDDLSPPASQLRAATIARLGELGKSA